MCQLPLENSWTFIGRSKTKGTAELLLAVPDLDEKPHFAKSCSFHSDNSYQSLLKIGSDFVVLIRSVLDDQQTSVPIYGDRETQVG